MTGFKLECHPISLCVPERSLHVEIDRLPQDGLLLRYLLAGDLASLRIPASQRPVAVDGLWRHTCFEAFIAMENSSAYREFNLSPSGQWAAYAFSGYREREECTIEYPPLIELVQTPEKLLLQAVVTADHLPLAGGLGALRLGLAAVLEEGDGKLSYWALRHPAAVPDFHHRGGFTAKLPS